MSHHSSDIQPFLDRLLTRSLLTDEEQQAIRNLPANASQALRNQDFVRLGERTDHACMVLAGVVGRFDQNSSGARQITALHFPGDMPDLLSVVQPTATSALQALSPTTLLRVSHEDLRKVAAAYPAIAEAFWRDCTVDTMMLAQWLVNIGRRNAKARLAHLLCEIAVRRRANTHAAEVKFDLRMTQEQVADATGLTPVHVNRSLMALREIGTTWRGGIVRIADWPAMTELGDFDPSYLQMDIAPETRLRIAASATPAPALSN